MTQRIRLYAFVVCLTLVPLGMTVSSVATMKSKMQPKKMVLNLNSKVTGPGGKTSPFDHETHSLLKYSADRKSVIGCVECHHTDAPQGTLKGEFTTDDGRKVVFTTSERAVVLTTKLLEDAASAPVKGCRECHARAGEQPTEWPKIPELPNPNEDELPDPLPITNDIAYHDNCNTCHAQARSLDPKSKAPTTCLNCHNGATLPAAVTATPSATPPAKPVTTPAANPTPTAKPTPTANPSPTAKPTPAAKPTPRSSQ